MSDTKNTTASRRLGIPITGEPSQGQILSFDEDTESMVWVNNNGGGDNNSTKTATVSIPSEQNRSLYGYIKLPFNPRTDTIKHLEVNTINSDNEVVTLSYADGNPVQAPNGKVILPLLLIGRSGDVNFKFNIRASDTVNTADGNIIYSTTVQFPTPIYPGVVDTGKFLTIEAIEGHANLKSSMVVTNDI